MSRPACAAPVSPSRARARRCWRRPPASHADQVFLDLEDAVAPELKNDDTRTARRRRAAAARRGSRRRGACASTRSTRRWCLDDVTFVVARARAALDCVIVPKVESAAQVHFVSLLLEQLERKHGLERAIGLELQIESPRGLVEIERHRGRVAARRDADLRPGRLRRGRGHAAAHGRRDRARLPRRSLALRPRAHRRRPRAPSGCRRSTARTRRSATSTAFARSARRSRAARLRRQVGAPPRPDRHLQRDLRADAGRVRARGADPRRVPRRDRAGRAGRGHVRGRDDRRGLAQDGGLGRRARPRRRNGRAET